MSDGLGAEPGGEAFRRRAADVAELIARYHLGLETAKPVRCPREPGALLDALPAAPPEEGEPWERVLGDVERLVLPGLTHWQAPGFFAYFPANASGPSMLGEFLGAGLGVQGMLWQTSPACTELETRVLDWTAGMIGLPEAFLSTATDGAGVATGGGVIQGTASEAVLVAMVAARERVGRAIGESPLAGPTVYVSSEAHSSVVKAARICGLGDAALRGVPVRGDRSMDAAAFEEMLRADLAAGRRPVFVNATLGTTSTGGFDPLEEIGSAIDRVFGGRGERADRPWLHVDAAWAGSAFVCPELRGPLAGVERADTFNFNPHKWLLTNFDCSALFTRDRPALVGALSITPEYLRNRASDAGSVIDYRDWQVPLGRRFRALKLWFVIREHGAAGLRSYIRGHVEMAERAEARVRASAELELTHRRSLSLVCLRGRGLSDEGSAAMLERVNASGEVFLTHTSAAPDPAVRSGAGYGEGDGGGDGGGRHVVRLAIGGVRTRWSHVERALELLESAAAAERGAR